MAKTKRRGLVFGLTMILAVALIMSVSAMGVFAAGTNVAPDATVSTTPRLLLRQTIPPSNSP